MRLQLAVLVTAVLEIQGAQAQELRRCNNPDLPTVPMRMRIVAIPGATVIGDANGEYSHDRSRCTSVTQVDGLFRFGTATGGEWPECAAATNREMTLDLTRPVKDGGGTSLGVMRGTNYMKVYVVAMLGSDGRNAGLDQMSVGQSVGAFWAAIELTDKATRRLWSVIFNPDAQVCNLANTAPGSTRMRVTRVSESQWRLDLPERSMGRLYRGPSGRVNRENDQGLFYVTGQFVVERQ